MSGVQYNDIIAIANSMADLKGQVATLTSERDELVLGREELEKERDEAVRARDDVLRFVEEEVEKATKELRRQLAISKSETKASRDYVAKLEGEQNPKEEAESTEEVKTDPKKEYYKMVAKNTLKYIGYAACGFAGLILMISIFSSLSSSS